MTRANSMSMDSVMLIRALIVVSKKEKIYICMYVYVFTYVLHLV